MSRILRLLRLAFVACFAAALHGQEPTFEVASVKPNRSSDQGITVDLAGGRFRAINMPLRELVRFAYDVQIDRLIGWPTLDIHGAL